MDSHEFSHHTPEEWDVFAFQIMANRGWFASDVSRNMGNMRIPSFKRYAHTYNAVREDMARSFVLASGRGVLWLPDGVDDGFSMHSLTKRCQRMYRGEDFR